MRRKFAGRARRGVTAFTLVELLIVIFVIVILTAIILQASQGVMTAAARSRTKGEIEAMKASLENYKTDNSTYPLTNTFATTNAYSTVDPTANNYLQASQYLYEQLGGKTNFMDVPVAGVRYYMTFKANQLGNVKTAAGTALGASSTYIADPYGYSYGYYTGDTNQPPQNPPVNGAGFYDLWSTGGWTTATTTTTPTATWISNWTQ